MHGFSTGLKNEDLLCCHLQRRLSHVSWHTHTQSQNAHVLTFILRVKSYFLGILGGLVECLCLCCGMTKWLCAIVHHCYASLCHCLATVQHRSLTPYCFFSSSLPVSQTWVFCWRKAHLTQIWSINKENARTTFPAESDSLQSFSSLLTLKSHDWNTENGSLHSRSFVGLFLRRFCKPQRQRLSAAAVFLLLRRFHNWDRAFRCTSLQNVNRQLDIYWILATS